MKRRQISWYCAFALGAGLSIGLSFADVPNLVSYQGKLVNANGTPVTNATRLRFRLYQGGDAGTFPSTGVLVYNETAVVTPEADGVFTRMIGSGTPGGGCPEGTCALTPGDFVFAPEGPVWIEVMVDPDGVVGTADDDVLLPRTQVGAVGFAFHAASVDGAVGGQITGDLTVSGSIMTQNTIVSSEGVATAGTVTAGGGHHRGRDPPGGRARLAGGRDPDGAPRHALADALLALHLLSRPHGGMHELLRPRQCEPRILPPDPRLSEPRRHRRTAETARPTTS